MPLASWLDHALPQLPSVASLPLVLGLALLLGIRHATDPDHLAAVTALVGGDARPNARAATRLGLAWGAGHALTLSALGAPAILAQPYLPERLQRGAEALVGLVIVVLAARLLKRWHDERLHVHVHEHPRGVRHAHVHAHPRRLDRHHAHHADPVRPRTPAAAFGIGLLHGLAGSAGPTLLLLASLESKALAVASLLVLALGTAVSMSALSTGFGLALARAPARPALRRIVPLLGATSLCFGIWYGLAALSVIPTSS